MTEAERLEVVRLCDEAKAAVDHGLRLIDEAKASSARYLAERAERMAKAGTRT